MKEHNKQILQRKRQRNDIQKKIAQKLERRRAEAEQVRNMKVLKGPKDGILQPNLNNN